MLPTVIVAVLAPVVVGVALLAMRQRQPRLATDTRGIALQTVIIIVVLLAIAGMVAGVLFSRAGDVTAELEAVDVTAGRTHVATRAECRSTGGTIGDKRPASSYWSIGVASAGQCVWTASAPAVAAGNTTQAAAHDTLRQPQCQALRGGVYTPSDASASTATGRLGKCTVRSSGII